MGVHQRSGIQKAQIVERLLEFASESEENPQASEKLTFLT